MANFKTCNGKTIIIRDAERSSLDYGSCNCDVKSINKKTQPNTRLT